MIYVRIRAVAGSEASDGLTSQTVGELVMICRLKSLDVILLDISGLVAADRLLAVGLQQLTRSSRVLHDVDLPRDETNHTGHTQLCAIENEFCI
jgi:hypothetical protein